MNTLDSALLKSPLDEEWVHWEAEKVNSNHMF